MEQVLIPFNGNVFTFINETRGLALFLILLIEESGVPMPIPGDFLILYSGSVLISIFEIISTFIGVLIGAVLGSTFLFTISRHIGRPIIYKFGKYVLFPKKRLQKIEKFFHRHSHDAVLFGRFLPGMRVIISLVAGIMGMKYKDFIGQVALATTVWATGLIIIGKYFGNRWENFSSYIERFGYAFVLFFIIGAYLVFKRSKATNK